MYVTLIHGFGVCAFCWTHVVKTLEYLVDLVDLRGQASSPALRGLGRVRGLCLCPVLGPSEVLEDLEVLQEGRREGEPGQLVLGVEQG